MTAIFIDPKCDRVAFWSGYKVLRKAERILARAYNKKPNALQRILAEAARSRAYAEKTRPLTGITAKQCRKWVEKAKEAACNVARMARRIRADKDPSPGWYTYIEQQMNECTRCVGMAMRPMYPRGKPVI